METRQTGSEKSTLGQVLTVTGDVGVLRGSEGEPRSLVLRKFSGDFWVPGHRKGGHLVSGTVVEGTEVLLWF